MRDLSGSVFEAAALDKLDGAAGRSRIQAEIQRPSSDVGGRYREYFSAMKFLYSSYLLQVKQLILFFRALSTASLSPRLAGVEMGNSGPGNVPGRALFATSLGFCFRHYDLPLGSDSAPHTARFQLR